MFSLSLLVGTALLLNGVNAYAGGEKNSEKNSESLSEKLRDPTRPFGYRDKQKARLKVNLQAIFLGNGRKEAVINGQSLKVGDHFNGHKLISISKNSVRYSVEGKVHVLMLRKNIFKL